MNNPLGVSPSKGNQGNTHEVKKKSFDLGGNRTHDLRIRSTNTLRSRTEKVRDDLGGLFGLAVDERAEINLYVLSPRSKPNPRSLD